MTDHPPVPMARGPLPAADAAAVRALAERARQHDGVSALSEQFLLDLEAPAGGTHLVLGTPLVGYAQLATDGSAELVVDPAHRGAGAGRMLLATILGLAPQARLWAHGDLPAARALAARHGLAAQRELYLMARPLGEADRSADRAAPLPAPLRARAFEPGRDEEAWLAVNAAAFAHHPEQGRLTLADLQARMAQAWFDPAGLLLVEDPTELVDGRPRVVAFHWTKVDPGQAATTDPGQPAGEVYVVGIHPDRQGRGLAGPVTALGTSHLARLGLPEVILYVDGDNIPARRTYARAGFSDAAVHVVYARPADLRTCTQPTEEVPA